MEYVNVPYTPNDPTCPVCGGAVEPQHSKNTDPVTSKPSHDYCVRTETQEHRSLRTKKAEREFRKAFTPNRHGEYA
jgi:hypothetical protein